MNTIKNLFKLAFIALLVVSCEDEDKIRFQPDGPVNAGAFVTADIQTAFINGDDIPNGVYSFIADAPSNNVESYSMTVRRASADGSVVTDFVPLLTITEFPQEIVITSADLAAAFGITVADLQLGDTFTFLNSSTGTDGSVVTLDTLDPDLSSEGGQLQAYRLSTLIVCPIDDALYVGEYNITTTMGGNFGDIYLDQVVELEILSPYQRTFEAVYLEQFGIGQPAMTFTIEFLCGVVTGRDGMSTFLGCAGGSLILNSSPLAGPYDETDDSTLVINARENAAGCGGNPEGEIQLTLTKV